MKRSFHPGNALFICLASILGGCANPSLSDQANLSRTGMLFSDSPALSTEPGLLSSIEPGTDARGGASASGCTACK